MPHEYDDTEVSSRDTGPCRRAEQIRRRLEQSEAQWMARLEDNHLHHLPSVPYDPSSPGTHRVDERDSKRDLAKSIKPKQEDML